MLTYLMIRTKHGKNRIAFDKLRKHNEFIEVHEVLGRYDIVCLLETVDLAELKTFIQNKCWIIEDLDKIESLIVSDDGSDINNVPKEEYQEEEEESIILEKEELDEDGQFLPP